VCAALHEDVDAETRNAGALNDTSAEPYFSSDSIARSCVPMMSLAMEAVWAGSNLSMPGNLDRLEFSHKFYLRRATGRENQIAYFI
jgi:hypothetical protein